MKNHSVMQHSFDRTPKVKMPRSVFNRSHGWKGLCDTDFLYPFYVDEVLPGDTFNLKATVLTRLFSSAIRPFMDNLWIDTAFFFVPNRLVWLNWAKFMGEQNNPGDSISYNVPQCVGPNVASSGIPIGHLFDYMGLPVGPLSGGGGTTGIAFNNLHGRAYNLIYNTWYRSQDISNSVQIDVGDGPDTFSQYNLLRRQKRFDYFTQALPYLQKSSTAVPLVLAGSAPVVTSVSAQVSGAQQPLIWVNSAGNSPAPHPMQVSSAGVTQTNTGANGTVAETLYPQNLYADLTSTAAGTINGLRQAIATQQFLERDARGGTRYPELISSHFGVENPDARVQKPEILGLSSSPLKIFPVAQTSATGLTGGTTSTGTLSGFGAGAANGGFVKSFTEHGVLIGLLNFRADITYQQGQDRMWNRRTRYDYFWPTYAHLGEQSILNREIYANLPDGTGAAQKDGVFGYVPRHDEYRFKKSLICADLRSYNGNSVNASTVDLWHLSEAFSSQPVLNTTFMEVRVPLDRCISVPAQPHFIVDAFFDLKCARVMPVFGVPGLTRL